MASCGLDRETGLPSYDLDHVAQCVEFIYATRLGSLIMARGFGGGLVELLGRRITVRLVALYRMLLALSIAAWEPRLQVAFIRADGNTANAVRLGQLKFRVLAYYRPRGHLGDFTIEGGLRGFTLAAADNRIRFDLERDVRPPQNA